MKASLIIIVCLFLSACGSEKPYWGDEAAITPYDANCLRQIQLGRDYVAHGRYELAKEYFLVALASSRDPETRNIIAHELNSVEMMIKTQR